MVKRAVVGGLGRLLWRKTTSPRVDLYQGHVNDVLRSITERSVQCVVTSPPYWGLRDYGVKDQIGQETQPFCRDGNCGHCYVCTLVRTFRVVRRTLRDDGVVWLNLGDTYSTIGNLLGVPWRVALALQADGWILRQDVIWAKKSPIPESVHNRCTKSHEHVFLLTKERGYFSDFEAIKGVSEYARSKGTGVRANRRDVWWEDDPHVATILRWLTENEPEVAARFLGEVGSMSDVWSVASQGYVGAHFATFPPNLIRPMILAGTSEYGACAECGTPWKRVVEKKAVKRYRPNEYVKKRGEPGTGNSCANTVAGTEVKTIGWEKMCQCGTEEVLPCKVLDPFIGSGTTAAVCVSLGRSCVGIDLNVEYLKDHAIPRIVKEIEKVVPP